MPNGNTFYGDFLTLTPRSKIKETLLYQQQSHEPYEHLASRKHNFYQNNGNTQDVNDTEHSYLNSLETLKLDHKVLHFKLFYQNESFGNSNEYVITNNNQQKKQHVVMTNLNSNLSTNIVSPPNQFSNESNINRFIKL